MEKWTAEDGGKKKMTVSSEEEEGDGDVGL